MASQHCVRSLLLRGRDFSLLLRIFTPCTMNLLLFLLNRETKAKGHFIYFSFVSPRRAELGDQNLSKHPVLVPVTWEDGRSRQQGSVLVTGPTVKILDTLHCSCSSTALAVQGSVSMQRQAIHLRHAGEGKLVVALGERELAPPVGGPGTIWDAVKAWLALGSLLATALDACGVEVLPPAWAARPIPAVETHSLRPLL